MVSFAPPLCSGLVEAAAITTVTAAVADHLLWRPVLQFDTAELICWLEGFTSQQSTEEAGSSFHF